MGSVMGKIIRFPIERCRAPYPCCEVCNEEYLVREEARDFIVVSHSCKAVPFDERLLWRKELVNATDKQGRDHDSDTP